MNNPSVVKANLDTIENENRFNSAKVPFSLGFHEWQGLPGRYLLRLPSPGGYDHLKIFASSWLMVLIRLFSGSPLKLSVVTSAKIITLQSQEKLMTSIIKTRNIEGFVSQKNFLVYRPIHLKFGSYM